MNNSTTEHDSVKLIVSFQLHILIFQEITKIGENPLICIVDLTFHQNFVIFAICSKTLNDLYQ